MSKIISIIGWEKIAERKICENKKAKQTDPYMGVHSDIAQENGTY